jgi:hypothetical protein
MTAAAPRPRWIGNSVVAVAAGLYGLLVANALASRSSAAAVEGFGPNGLGELVLWTMALAYAVVGGVVLRHSAHNRIGAVVGVMGLVLLLGEVSQAVVAHRPPPGFGAEVATWIGGWHFSMFLVGFLAIFHVFPTGQPMSGVWRWWYRIAVLGGGAFLVRSAFGPGFQGFVNPFDLPVASSALLNGLYSTAGFVGLVSGVVSLGVRFRRARGRERAQLKWFFFSTALGLAVWFGSLEAGEALVRAAALALPAVGILIAVTRHGLFDIDRIVSRTVSYAVVGLVVVAVYGVPVVVIPEVLGLSSDLTVALATLAAAAVFSPLRRRIQSAVDRRFDRGRYDAERVVAAFSGTLQTAVDLDTVSEELGRAIGTTFHPVRVSLWFAGS